MNAKRRVLVLRPHLDDPGGVAAYYNLLSKYFSSKRIDLEFYYTGKTESSPGYVRRAYKTMQDLNRLTKRLGDFDLVVLNPSLDPKAVFRDGIFHIMAKRFYKRNTLIFFHGWSPWFEEAIDKCGKSLFRVLFNFNKACVLSKHIRAKLIEWGFDENSIVLETTVFEGHRFETSRDRKKTIFLSRFVRNKGCLHAIKAIEALSKNVPGIHLFMVGDGELMSELQDYVKTQNLSDNITFTGYLSGSKKYRLLSECGIMIYPTFYGEGMPISLLEGMGMGLVPVTRPSGGIPDIVIEGKNGFVVDSSDPNAFADRIRYLIENEDAWKAMSEKNYEEASERFEIKNVVRRLERLYSECAQAR